MRNTSLCDSRHKILETLKRKKSTVDELSGSLGISPTAVRQHLTILEGDSLIKGETVKHGMGRPKLVYSLKPEAENFFPKRYHILAEALVEEIMKEGEEHLKLIIKDISSKIIEPYRKEVRGKGMKARISVLGEIFEEGGGYAEIKEDGGDFILIRYNCPISLMSSKYPLLCDIDKNIIRNITGCRVIHEKRMSRNEDYCLYRIIAKDRD